MEPDNKKPEKTRPEWRRLISHKWIVKNIPFFLFLAALAILYIYNGHHADKLMRNITKTEKNIKELEYEYKTIKADVIYRSKASELIKAVEPLGLKEPKQPPAMLASGNTTGNN
ncbi:MAG: FtsL-like putative cell division protein [Ferruginibacter sp.]